MGSCKESLAITECGCLMASPQLQHAGGGGGQWIWAGLFCLCLTHPSVSSFEVQHILVSTRSTDGRCAIHGTCTGVDHFMGSLAGRSDGV